MENFFEMKLNTAGTLTCECFINLRKKIHVCFRSYGTLIANYIIENDGERKFWFSYLDYSRTTIRHKGYVASILLDWATSNADEFDIVDHLKALARRQCKLQYLPKSMWGILY